MAGKFHRFVRALGAVAGDFVRHPFTDPAAGAIPATHRHPPPPAVAVAPAPPPGTGALHHLMPSKLFDKGAAAGKVGANAAAPSYQKGPSPAGTPAAKTSDDAAAPDFLVEEIPLRSVSTFKTILWFLMVVSVGSLIGHVTLSFLWTETTDAQNYSLGLLDWGFKGGFGTILGMFGGKAAVEP